MDSIFISEFKVETLIGIYDWERRVAQTIELNLEIGLAGGHAAQSGELADTIDYSRVVAAIEQLFREQHFLLLEKAAEAIAGMVLRDFRAPWLRLSIAKPGALRNVKKVGLTIERGQRT